MKLTVEQFSSLEEPVPVVVHSIEQALYQVTVLIDGAEHLLVENSGRTFRRHSLQQVREALQTLPVASITLRQVSAYDEMIGQPAREHSNALSIPLSLDDYPPPVIH
jgi:hypothetical protein